MLVQALGLDFELELERSEAIDRETMKTETLASVHLAKKQRSRLGVLRGILKIGAAHGHFATACDAAAVLEAPKAVATSTREVGYADFIYVVSSAARTTADSSSLVRLLQLCLNPQLSESPWLKEWIHRR